MVLEIWVAVSWAWGKRLKGAQGGFWNTGDYLVIRVLEARGLPCENSPRRADV